MVEQTGHVYTNSVLDLASSCNNTIGTLGNTLIKQ